MATVELIYDRDCPNIPQARKNLLRAFHQVHLTPRWREWNRSDAETPPYAQAFGSPTVLVNGKDVAGADHADAACCRIYAGGDGSYQGAPPVALIAAELANAEVPATQRSGRHIVPLLPAIGTAILPKLICPACWPAFAGLLSALGFGIINYGSVRLPLDAVFLVVLLGTLGWRARARRGYAPFALGVLASTMVLAGKFHFESNAATYAGIALLVGASLWNSWPRRNQTTTCPACEINMGQINPIGRKEVP